MLWLTAAMCDQPFATKFEALSSSTGNATLKIKIAFYYDLYYELRF